MPEGLYSEGERVCLIEDALSCPFSLEVSALELGVDWSNLRYLVLSGRSYHSMAWGMGDNGKVRVVGVFC